VIYGFFKDVLSLCIKYHTNDVVFVFDHPINFRKKVFSGYKEKRWKTPLTEEELELRKIFRKQLIQIRKHILKDIGFNNVFCIRGYEADDLFASILTNNERDNYVIISADQDLYQLLDSNVVMYNPTKGKEVSYIDFVKNYGIHPGSWSKVKEIAGCKTDEVPGIQGVGEKTAIRFLNGDLQEKSVIKARILSMEGRKIRKRNRRLVKLPFRGTPEILLADPQRIDSKQFTKNMRKFGISSLHAPSIFGVV
jgi:DNA polymerase-1